MGEVLLRNLEDEVIAAHRTRAETRGVSLEQELREVLRRAARPTREELLVEIARCRGLTPAGHRTRAEDIIRAGRASA
jgi:plasmid stability protein